jgi:hypothetical protein
MTTRTIRTTVTFTRPFSLSGFDGQQPAGSYSVETDEELLEGVSFPAYRRMATMMQLSSDASSKNNTSGILQVAVIDPRQLATALAADAAQNGGFVGDTARRLRAPTHNDLER